MNSVSAATCFSLYKMARLIRRTQEILIEEYTAKQEMRCPMHFCIGQEGTPTALSPLLRAEDYIVSHYRSHGYYLAKGAPLTEMLAEFHGKVTGSNSGFAGSMELAHEEKRIFSGAIVGGPIAIAMGIAFAVKYREVPGIVIAVVGDGSMAGSNIGLQRTRPWRRRTPVLTAFAGWKRCGWYIRNSFAVVRNRYRARDRQRACGRAIGKLPGLSMVARSSLVAKLFADS